MKKTGDLKRQIEIEFGGMQVSLRHDGTVFLPHLNTLLVADLHLGKEASFRANSIPVPDGPTATTLNLLTNSLHETQSTHLMVLGDLIHDANSLTSQLIDNFSRWRQQHYDIKMTLIRGNHDRHVEHFPTDWNLAETATVELSSNKQTNPQTITLVHQATTGSNSGPFIEGHWHPVVKIGSAADQVRVRCFAQTETKLTLPAFGPFKGGYVINQRNTTVFPIVDGFVIKPCRI